jgi:hypothetical protein
LPLAIHRTSWSTTTPARPRGSWPTGTMQPGPLHWRAISSPPHCSFATHFQACAAQIGACRQHHFGNGQVAASRDVPSTAAHEDLAALSGALARDAIIQSSTMFTDNNLLPERFDTRQEFIAQRLMREQGSGREAARCTGSASPPASGMARTWRRNASWLAGQPSDSKPRNSEPCRP